MEAIGNISSVANKTSIFMNTRNITVTRLAEEINYSRPTLSLYLHGRYTGNTKEIEKKLEKYLAEHSAAEPVALPKAPARLIKDTPFESRDMLEIAGVCSTCQEEVGLGIIVGKTGLGKTHALKYYTKTPRVAYIECDDSMGIRNLLEAIEHALGIHTSSLATWQRTERIKAYFNVNPGYLLILDEADKLINKHSQKKLEIIRAIYDQSRVGIVIAGEPKLEMLLKTFLQRFANRVDSFVVLKGLTPPEVERYLTGYDIEPDALAELKKRACNPHTGCFRLLDRTMRNVRRVLEYREEKTITVEVIADASGMMML